MPAPEHNGLVEMFRENPSLAPHLVERLLGLEVPAYASVSVVESSLEKLVPVELQADLVLELCDEKGARVLSIIVEVQRERDPNKLLSWPLYLAAARARRRCPALVLVVAPDAKVAAWAGQSIDLGLGLATVEPLVLGPAVVPEVTDPAGAEREAALAVLSAVVHGNGPNGLAIVLTAFNALERLGPNHTAAYLQIIHDALREPVRRALEERIMDRQTELKGTWPPFAQRLIDRGKLEGMREGLLEGMREGLLEGMREGLLKGKREALLRLVERRGLSLTEEQRARVEACTDAARLDRWFDNAVGAETAAGALT